MRPHNLSIAPDRLRPASSSFVERTGHAQTGTVESAAAPGRSPLTAVCVGMALAVFLWMFGAGLSSSNPRPGASSRTTIAKVWDNHQDLTRASVVVTVPTATRRPHNSPTRIAVPCTAVPLPDAGYRVAEQHRPLALSPNRSQVRLRAPPVLA
jgi:hypothetical protein